MDLGITGLRVLVPAVPTASGAQSCVRAHTCMSATWTSRRLPCSARPMQPSWGSTFQPGGVCCWHVLEELISVGKVRSSGLIGQSHRVLESTRLTHKGHAAESLLYYLVGAGEERGRHGEAERLGGLEVDDQLVFCRLLHR